MLKIVSIIGENFKSFKKFDFNIEEGLFVVCGDNKDDPLSSSNGSGKTTLFCDSIYWCLTGKSIEGLESADDIVNFKTKKDCFVEVTLFSDDRKIKIKRTRKHTQYKNNLFLEVDDQDLSAHRVDDTQTRVNQIIKISPDILKSTIIMTSDIKSRFSDLTPKDRISLLESIRDYKVWDRFRDETKVSLDDYIKRIQEVNSENLTKQGEMNAIQKIIDNQTVSLLQLQNTVIDMNEISNKQVLLDQISTQKDNQDMIQNLKQVQESCQKQIQEIELKNRQQLQESKNLYSKQAQLASLIQKCELDIQTKVSLLQVNGTCPTCGQKLQLSEDKKNKLFIELSDLKKKYVEYTTEKQGLDSQVSQISNDPQDTSVLRQKSQSINEQIMTMEKSDMNRILQINSLKSDIYSLTERANTHSTRITELETSINSYKENLNDLKTIIDSNNNKIKDLEIEKNSYQFFYDSLGPKGTLRPYLLSKDIAYLNKCLQYYSGRMFGSSKISLTKPTLDSNKIDIIFECGDMIKPISTLSRGERKRLDLCIQFALYDLVKSTAMFDINLLILDEIFESLDVTGISQVVSILQERSENIPSIYVISHNPNAYDLIQKKIIVSKSNDISKIKFVKKTKYQYLPTELAILAEDEEEDK